MTCFSVNLTFTQGMPHSLKAIIATIITAAMLCACSQPSRYETLQARLADFASSRDANIGIAVIIDGRDTVAVNGHRAFPMLSVYKFPIALALCDVYRSGRRSFGDSILVTRSDMRPDTYSPMTVDYPDVDSIAMPVRQLLAYSLLNLTGGAGAVDSYLRRIGSDDIYVRDSEYEMHLDSTLCYRNSSTPIAMAALLDRFATMPGDSLTDEIRRIMETCRTGADRLAAPFRDTHITFGHKTGTGFTLPDGRLMAVNDAGYALLPDGHRYTIAVFIENSGYGIDSTSAIIAEISRLTLTDLR